MKVISEVDLINENELHYWKYEYDEGYWIFSPRVNIRFKVDEAILKDLGMDIDGLVNGLNNGDIKFDKINFGV